jgi:hypothetical protein
MTTNSTPLTQKAQAKLARMEECIKNLVIEKSDENIWCLAAEFVPLPHPLHPIISYLSGFEFTETTTAEEVYEGFAQAEIDRFNCLSYNAQVMMETIWENIHKELHIRQLASEKYGLSNYDTYTGLQELKEKGCITVAGFGYLYLDKSNSHVASFLKKKYNI